MSQAASMVFELVSVTPESIQKLQTMKPDKREKLLSDPDVGLSFLFSVARTKGGAAICGRYVEQFAQMHAMDAADRDNEISARLLKVLQALPTSQRVKTLSKDNVLAMALDFDVRRLDSYYHYSEVSADQTHNAEIVKMLMAAPDKDFMAIMNAGDAYASLVMAGALFNGEPNLAARLENLDRQLFVDLAGKNLSAYKYYDENTCSQLSEDLVTWLDMKATPEERLKILSQQNAGDFFAFMVRGAVGPYGRYEEEAEIALKWVGDTALTPAQRKQMFGGGSWNLSGSSTDSDLVNCCRLLQRTYDRLVPEPDHGLRL